MDLETRINYQFKNPTLLQSALTHRSYRFENIGIDEDNQRLEFLGDAVLDLLAAEKLYLHYPDAPEGDLSKLRSRYTSDAELARTAQFIQLGNELLLGQGESQSGGHDRLSNLADALEALFGAVFLDAGFPAARKVFDQLFQIHGEGVQEVLEEDNPKGRLLEYSQEKWKETPVYRLVDESGPAHEKTFAVEVRLPNGQEATGTGKSKQAAEIEAARGLLRRIEFSGSG